MSKIIKAFVFLSIFMYQITAHADLPSSTMLKALLESIQTIRADFNQTMTDKNVKQVKQSVGRMALERPSKFRWEVKEPTAQLVITDGKRLWIYDPDLEQVTIRLLTKEVGESPAMLLSNPNMALEKNFSVQMITEPSSLIRWFLLTPKNQDSLFSFIKFGFLNDVIHQMILQDRLGHTTTIEFFNIQLNPTLSSTLFSFKPPDNVDIIDETRR